MDTPIAAKHSSWRTSGPAGAEPEIPPPLSVVTLNHVQGTIRSTVGELQAVRNQIQELLGPAMGDIVDLFITVINDERFPGRLLRHVRHNRMSLEQAATLELTSLEKLMIGCSEFFTACASDIRAVRHVVLQHLIQNCRRVHPEHLPYSPAGGLLAKHFSAPHDSAMAFHREALALSPCKNCPPGV